MFYNSALPPFRPLQQKALEAIRSLGSCNATHLFGFVPIFHALQSVSIWMKHWGLYSQACTLKTPKRPLFSKKFWVVGAAFHQSANMESFSLQTRLCWPQFYKRLLFLHRLHLEIQCKALRNNSWGILCVWVDLSCLGEVDLLSVSLSLEISMSRKLIQLEK